MLFTSARLQNFRSYIDSSFEFEPHVNIIVGPNASGKTNLLDALFLAATGGSMKLTKAHMINEHKTWARIDILTNQNQERVIKIKSEDQRPEIAIDQKVYKRLPFDQRVPVVLFEPNHLYFITTSPEMRRQFIDDILEKTDRTFVRTRNAYLRTLRQRNTLLKQALPLVKQQIFAWDVRLCELASHYVEKRQELIRTINDSISETYSLIANQNHKLKLQYETKGVSIPYSTHLLKLLQENLDTDYQRGFTGYGPHRDDFAIVIDSKDMRDVASRGETRSILLALKVTESQIVEKVHDKKPLLLLDDVFGELDGTRRKSLIEFMSSNQTFITTTDADTINHQFTRSAHTIMTTLDQ